MLREGIGESDVRMKFRFMVVVNSGVERRLLNLLNRYNISTSRVNIFQ